MGYSKFISYGDNLEVYEYEKDVIRTALRRSAVTRKRDNAKDDLGTAGEDTLSERKLGKRQDNARRASLGFRRIVAANLGGSVRPILATLTYRDNLCELSEAYRHLSAFIQHLRYRYGKSFRYVCVPEFQKRGAVHFHALFWGLPESVFSRERKDRAIATLWGQGFVYLKQTDGNEKLSFYLSKYMAKAFADPRLKNQKCYVTSRNIQRPTIQIGASPAWALLDEYKIDEKSALVDREYSTRWLGKGRYRLFKIPDDLT